MSAALLLVAGLTLDLLHYVTGSLTWGIYHRKKEREGTLETADFAAPSQLTWTSLFLLV
jgi:hypothetical protein